MVCGRVNFSRAEREPGDGDEDGVPPPMSALSAPEMHRGVMIWVCGRRRHGYTEVTVGDIVAVSMKEEHFNIGCECTFRTCVGCTNARMVAMDGRKLSTR